jgi:hypothetical protein
MGFTHEISPSIRSKLKVIDCYHLKKDEPIGNFEREDGNEAI